MLLSASLLSLGEHPLSSTKNCLLCVAIRKQLQTLAALCEKAEFCWVASLPTAVSFVGSWSHPVPGSATATRSASTFSVPRSPHLENGNKNGFLFSL